MNMIGSLSGGNQQKLILARWLLQSPTSMLLLHEPTQGVDAGAKKDILSSIAEAARSGRGVLISSSDYDELAHVCDRILVFSEGRIVGGMSKPISVENILSLAYLGESTSRPSIEMSAP
jgi:ribose transport system ATP-binding protein